MYSRNMHDRQGSFDLPPGYDGSRFRRRRRHGGDEADEVILIPDSGFAPADESAPEDPHSGELSISGIPTDRGRRYSASAEISATDERSDRSGGSDTHDPPVQKERSPATDKLTGILEKFGFGGGLSSDELLLLAVIFIIASDSAGEGGNAGDILLILALLLGLR